MNKIAEIKFKEIKRISPSQFYSMKNCAYKSLLAESFDKKPLLPLSPNAYFGTVLHKILELITKGIIKSEIDFNIEFEKQVKILENELSSNGFHFFVPLKIKLRNFGLKKIQLKKHLRSYSEKPTDFSYKKYYSEKWFESHDKMIGGKVDLIIESGSNIEIIDFKTGEITEDILDDDGEIFSEVKNDYKEQLKLYAYLYFENTNKFPTSLTLVDLTKQKYLVDFTKEECKVLFDDAKKLLESTNYSIKSRNFSANPIEENCKFCLYRPACSFYNNKFERDFTTNDVFGKVKDIKKFQNGNVSIFLENGTQIITIKNFKIDSYNILNNYTNKQIRIYNLRNEIPEYIYSVTDTTMIYE